MNNNNNNQIDNSKDLIKTARRSNHNSRIKNKQIKSKEIDQLKLNEPIIYSKFLHTPSEELNSYASETLIEPDFTVLNIDYQTLINTLDESLNKFNNSFSSSSSSSSLSPLSSYKSISTTELTTYQFIQHILNQPICEGIKFQYSNDIKNIRSNLQQQTVNDFLYSIKEKIGPDSFNLLIVILEAISNGSNSNN